MWRIARPLFQLHGTIIARTSPSYNLSAAATRAQDLRRPSQDGQHSFDQLPIVHIKATYNNTIVTVTDCAGKTLNWASGGQQGFKGAKRKTTTAAEAAGVAAAQTASTKGIKRIRVKVKGLGPRGQWVTAQSAVKGLQAGGLDIVSITDVTPVPHNGCKPRKARRI